MALPVELKTRLIQMKPQTKAQRIIDIAKKIGIYEGVMYGVGEATDWAVNIWDGLVDGGIDPRELEKPDEVSRQVILTELARNGVKVDFSKADPKTFGERLVSGFNRITSDFHAQRVAKEKANRTVDESQPKVTTDSGQDDFERMVHFKRLSDACGLLGFTGTNRFQDLYNMAYAINSITDGDVKEIAKIERIMGAIQ